MLQFLGKRSGLEPKEPPDMGKLLIQALQLCVLAAGFLYYLDHQSNAVIWASIVACIGFGVAAGIVLDKLRMKKARRPEDHADQP